MTKELNDRQTGPAAGDATAALQTVPVAGSHLARAAAIALE